VTLALVTAPLTASAERELESLGFRLVRAGGAGPLPALAAAAGLDAARVEALVVEAEPVGDDVLAAFPRLRLVACLRGDPVNVDLDAATRRGVPVLHAPGRNAEAVADFALGLVISTLRHIARTHHLIVARELTEEREPDVRPRRDVIWRPADPALPVPYRVYQGPELRTLTLGLLGFGLVGRRVAEKALALEMRVVAHDPHVGDAEIAVANPAALRGVQLAAPTGYDPGGGGSSR
jgi:D-3-phosphoglycerate dehydrogenase